MDLLVLPLCASVLVLCTSSKTVRLRVIAGSIWLESLFRLIFDTLFLLLVFGSTDYYGHSGDDIPGANTSYAERYSYGMTLGFVSTIDLNRIDLLIFLIASLILHIVWVALSVKLIQPMASKTGKGLKHWLTFTYFTVIFDMAIVLFLAIQLKRVDNIYIPAQIPLQSVFAGQILWIIYFSRGFWLAFNWVAAYTVKHIKKEATRQSMVANAMLTPHTLMGNSAGMPCVYAAELEKSPLPDYYVAIQSGFQNQQLLPCEGEEPPPSYFNAIALQEADAETPIVTDDAVTSDVAPPQHEEHETNVSSASDPQNPHSPA